jgi:hypothetical protein
MFDWLKQLFGKGTVRVEFEAVDDKFDVLKGSAKVPYIGRYDEDEVKRIVRNKIAVQHGVIVTKINVVARDGF